LFGNPLPEPDKVFTRQGFNFGLNCFNLGHTRSVRKQLPTGAFTTFIQPRSAMTGQVGFLGRRAVAGVDPQGVSGPFRHRAE
jgi:hypothetical protein